METLVRNETLKGSLIFGGRGLGVEQQIVLESLKRTFSFIMLGLPLLGSFIYYVRKFFRKTNIS